MCTRTLLPDQERGRRALRGGTKAWPSEGVLEPKGVMLASGDDCYYDTSVCRNCSAEISSFRQGPTKTQRNFGFGAICRRNYQPSPSALVSGTLPDFASLLVPRRRHRGSDVPLLPDLGALRPSPSFPTPESPKFEALSGFLSWFVAPMCRDGQDQVFSNRKAVA